MAKFMDYNPEQAYLLPPSVRDVLGPDHLCFFVRGVVEKLNLSAFRDEYGERRRALAYAPEMMVSVWLYAYALGVTSSRRLEQRIREDLAFRYLAGGATPDHWTLNAFRRRHTEGIERSVHARGGVGAKREGWDDWGMWPSTRRASRRTLRAIVWTPSKRCGRNGRAFGGTFAGGRSSATGRIRTKERARKWAAKLIAQLEQQLAEIPVTPGAAAEIGPEEAIAHRSGQPFSAGAGRIHAGLHGRRWRSARII